MNNGQIKIELWFYAHWFGLSKSLFDWWFSGPPSYSWLDSEFFVLFVNEYKEFRRWGYECFLVIIVEVDVLDPVSVGMLMVLFGLRVGLIVEIVI